MAGVVLRALPENCDRLLVRPWTDPVIDHVGYDPRSPYVERFWLGVLGPSATWFMRYLADLFDTSPDGYDLDVAECARAIGLGNPWGTTGAFPRTLRRCSKFSLLRMHSGRAILDVRRKLPPLSRRQVNRLPGSLRSEHARWVDDSPASAEVAALRDRARRLALSLLELGEDGDKTEQQLLQWRFPPAMASDATQWALDRQARPVSR